MWLLIFRHDENLLSKQFGVFLNSEMPLSEEKKNRLRDHRATLIDIIKLNVELWARLEQYRVFRHEIRHQIESKVCSNSKMEQSVMLANLLLDCS